MTFAHVTKSTPFNASDLAWLKRYQVVQFDKAQDISSMPCAGQEDRFIAAARQIRKANPKAKTLMYLNSLIDFPDFQRISNATAADPSLLLRNQNGTLVQLVTYRPHTCFQHGQLEKLNTFDMRQKRMRQLFIDAAVYGVRSGAFDGVFIDRANYALRVQLDLNNVSDPRRRAGLAQGWDAHTAATMVTAQTELFKELMSALDAALGRSAIVLAKETGGGAPFLDYKVANAAMTSDTFCSSYAPHEFGPRVPPKSCGGACAENNRWSVPILGHSPRHVMQTFNATSFAQCQEACAKLTGCESVLMNVPKVKDSEGGEEGDWLGDWSGMCLLHNTSYNANFECIDESNGRGCEWVSNRRAVGMKPCPSPPAPPPAWDPAGCLADMQTVVATAERGQLSENHGQGPMGDAAARHFTMSAFLVASGNYSYFSHAGWEMSEAWSLAGTEWFKEYDEPLGPPLDPPMQAAPGSKPDELRFRRRFASGTVADVDLLKHTAKLTWGKRKSQRRLKSDDQLASAYIVTGSNHNGYDGKFLRTDSTCDGVPAYKREGQPTGTADVMYRQSWTGIKNGQCTCPDQQTCTAWFVGSSGRLSDCFDGYYFLSQCAHEKSGDPTESFYAPWAGFDNKHDWKTEPSGFAVSSVADVPTCTQCATDWGGSGVCTCPGGRVKFGIYTRWSDWHDVSGDIECTDAVFGDPAYGSEKVCKCEGATPFCATEGDVCKCHGRVRYGVDTRWSDWRDVSDSIECDTEVFGDPAYGSHKVCECESSATDEDTSIWMSVLEYGVPVLLLCLVVICSSGCPGVYFSASSLPVPCAVVVYTANTAARCLGDGIQRGGYGRCTIAPAARVAHQLMTTTWKKTAAYEFISLTRVETLRNRRLASRYHNYKWSLPDDKVNIPTTRWTAQPLDGHILNQRLNRHDGRTTVGSLQ